LYKQYKEYIKIKADRTIVATGAGEKFLAFPNNDLPGIYGAGAVQTLMNEHGIVPGNNVLMVGAGNIGLIVSYQLCRQVLMLGL
jgi:sarcosine oxidase subunit alpha